MNFYPDQLRQIIGYIEALDSVSDVGAMPIFPRNGVVMVDGDGVVYGELHDEIGGSWSFTPAGTTSKAQSGEAA